MLVDDVTGRRSARVYRARNERRGWFIFALEEMKLREESRVRRNNGPPIIPRRAIARY
jgi:hypothetical protein